MHVLPHPSQDSAHRLRPERLGFRIASRKTRTPAKPAASRLRKEKLILHFKGTRRQGLCELVCNVLANLILGEGQPL